MPMIKCANCGKPIRITEAQFKLMIGTNKCCSYECAVKILQKEDS